MKFYTTEDEKSEKGFKNVLENFTEKEDWRNYRMNMDAMKSFVTKK